MSRLMLRSSRECEMNFGTLNHIMVAIEVCLKLFDHAYMQRHVVNFPLNYFYPRCRCAFKTYLNSSLHAVIWDALRAASEADLPTAKLIVESAGIVVASEVRIRRKNE